ncbi:RHS repeat-associated core domain-containing protein, partial [Aurantivibrio infirmus]
TTMAYDSNGNVSSVTNALGHVQQYTSYDASGRVLQMIDANGIVSDFTYTARGWLSTATLRAPIGSNSNDKLLQYGYDAVGQLTSMTMPNGSVIAYEYDGARRLTAIEDAQGNRIEYTLDAAGNRTAEVIKTSAGVATKSMTQSFDELSRLREVVGADNQLQQFNYDVNDNLTSDTNGRNFTTTQDYDALNRPTTTLNAESNTVEFTYDGRDNLTSVTDPRGLTTSYTYDAYDNVTELNSPDTGLTTFVYDDANNLISQTDARGVSVNYQYDALNRLTAETYPTSPSLNKTYTYDDTSNGNVGIGRLTQIQDQLGITQYRYDFSGNLLSNTQTIDGNTYSIAYEYNADDAVTQQTYPSNRRINFTRNNLEQITQITTTNSSGSTTTSLADTISYLPFGPLDNLSYGNGLVFTRNYDQDYRLTQHTIGSLAALSYDYDDNNNITDINNSNDPLKDQSFAYDAMDRLELENGEYGVQTYLYDEVGNRLEKTTATEIQTLTYASDSNRLIDVNGSPVTQDQTGNTTHTTSNSDNIEYRYGDNERYEDVYINSQLRASYRFNALGQRAKKTDYDSSGQIDHFEIYHYDPAGQLISTTIKNATGTTTQFIHYVWLDNLPLAQITDDVDTNGNTTATEILYLHADHLNTPRIATNQNQTEVWNWQSDAFGVGAADLDPDGDSNLTRVALRFPGQYYDEETGLHYNYFRDYDPGLGRYIESDPIGLMGGINTFGYVGGNP